MGSVGQSKGVRMIPLASSLAERITRTPSQQCMALLLRHTDFVNALGLFRTFQQPLAVFFAALATGE